ncbi:MAG: hypothetical protein JF595_14445 [Sphingomonadales bacterium]|nr:hypothetical protein [Sphingomonadales bacterium]
MGLLDDPDDRRELDGLTAVFRTRADADLAIEHLAQEYGIDPAFIYVEPVADENSAGTEPSGGDHACAAPSHQARPDAPLRGVIRLTVPVAHENLAILTNALKDTGARDIEVF